ncbi:MAG: F0F1 ATP synthase subunit gamma [Neisseriaceae bacterium]|jgi:F-type H+-transporting ATPase subunit gamma|nr:F-type H+-transporting ATPase subunit gamma [Pseudomonadota bacterium]RTK97174.1 MAG: F0F1 ATP synthase subunit gamma [Neisseriaceae bacterium]
MASGKEIRNKIKSVQNTQKITRAMEMVAASKMRKAQDRMKAARPYGEKIRRVAAHIAAAYEDYSHPFLTARESVKRVGLIVVTSDKGLCGGLNSNVLRATLLKLKEWESAGVQVDITCIGSKGFGFMQRTGARVVSHVSGLGDTPHLEKMIGPVKVQLDAYIEGKIDALYIASTKFVNTMKQEPGIEQLVPVKGEDLGERDYLWDYIYEPDAKTVIDQLMIRYVEALIYQSVAENMASEQSARMVAMKAASDNAGSVIDELKLVYNKTRQAAITKELSEIVGGAAAV